MRRSAPLSAVGIAAIVVLAVLLLYGLLYAYRSQTPALQTVPITQAIQEVQQGNVRDVTVEANRATLTLSSGERQVTNLPDNAATNPLEDAVNNWNRTNPTRQISTRFEGGSDPLRFIGSVLLSLLPIFLFFLLVGVVAYAIARGRAPDPYERLARAADLRDRGVLTEDEFQREKRRILGRP